MSNSNNWETLTAESSVKKCSTCNNIVTDSDKFCSKCGTRLLLKCLKCSNPVRPHDYFCSDCGTRLRQPAIVRLAAVLLVIWVLVGISVVSAWLLGY